MKALNLFGLRVLQTALVFSIVFMGNVHAKPEGIPSEVVCSPAPGTALPIQYTEEICKAFRYERAVDYKEAAAAYRRALSIDLYEAPNYVLLADLARTLCLSGQINDAKKALEEFEWAIKINAGEERCPRSRSVSATNAKARAARRMCTGYMEGQYDQKPTPELIKAIQFERQQKGRIEQICGAKRGQTPIK
jgi:tetratricopeptide (TPR) repeat protein